MLARSLMRDVARACGAAIVTIRAASNAAKAKFKRGDIMLPHEVGPDILMPMPCHIRSKAQRIECVVLLDWIMIALECARVPSLPGTAHFAGLFTQG